MPRIFIIVNYPITPSRIGGMDRFFWALNQALINQNLAPQWIFPEAKDVSHYTNQGMGNMVYLNPSNFIQSSIAYLKTQQNIDLLISIFSEYNGKHIGAWKKAGAKKLLVIDQMSRPAIPRSLKFKSYYFIKGLVNYANIDHIIAVSKYVKRSILAELGNWWSNKITVIYNAIDTSIFQFVPHTFNPEKIKIFCIAHLIPDKGIQTLIEAIGKLDEKLKSKIELNIAGDGPFKTSLQHLTKQVGIERQTHFLGNISNQHEYLIQSTCCVVPSIWKEAFGYTNIESMAVGCPLIASEIGGIPEIVIHEKTGLIFTSNDPESLTLQLENLFNNLVLYNHIQSEAKQTVETKFSLHQNIDQYLTIIKKLLNSHS